MTPENFVYWLQGFFEISNPKELNEQQIEVIKNHLGLVLTNVTDDTAPEKVKDFGKRIQDIMKNDKTFICNSGGNKKYC